MAYFIIFICRGFSSGSQAVNRGGGWLGNVHGNQHGMHKPPEQGGRSQGGENKSEDSFHTYSEIGGFVKGNKSDYLLSLVIATHLAISV